MGHFRLIFARTSGRLFIALLFAISSIPLGAQAAADNRTEGRTSYDASHETTVIGTIREVVTKPAAGSPAGMHLLVAGTGGVVDAHLGPYLSKETKQALLAGALVQIVGANVAVHGKQYLLARELTVAGRTITIRSAKGFLLRTQGEGREKTAASQTGGAL